MKNRTEIEGVNSTLKRFWEIEDTSVVGTGTMGDRPIVRIEEQSAMKKAEQSIQFENNMYRVGVPWRSNERALPNNYKMALRRLENTEKKLTSNRHCIQRNYQPIRRQGLYQKSLRAGKRKFQVVATSLSRYQAR